jgi:predicted transglutaminase-like cysteine proteinase
MAAAAQEAPFPAPAAPMRSVNKPIPSPQPPAAPDIFGFSALSLGQTIYDEIWNEAATRPWPVQNPELDAFVASIRSLPIHERVQQANAWINARVRPGNDPKLIDPHWAGLAQVLAAGSGEREDIAIAKMQLLAATGVPRRDLYLVLASDIRRYKPDALLVVRDGRDVYVLDSSQDAILDERQSGLYLPIIALGYDGKWIFGRHADGRPAGLDVGRAAYQSLLP